jgi:hypothetical protein
MKSGFLLLLFTFLAPALASAANIPVNSLSALQSAIDKAAPGDVITLAPGVYTATQDITVSKAGTAAQPITITAQAIGEAEIGGLAAAITGPFPNAQWQNNLLYQVGAPGDMPAGSFQTLAAKLVREAAGAYHLAATSPLIGAVKESYPAITVDMDGQPRTAPLEPGADERSKAPVIARLLSPVVVGHTAKQ